MIAEHTPATAAAANTLFVRMLVLPMPLATAATRGYQSGVPARSSGQCCDGASPLDADRAGDTFFVHIDLPGVDPSTIDATVDRKVLTVRAEGTRPQAEDVQRVVTERPTGTVTRRLQRGDSLDTERLEAEYDAGMLTLRIPVAERARPSKIEIVSRPELANT
jgi:HSP20 family protein